MTQTPCPYDNRIRPRSYNSIVPEVENFRIVDATNPYLPPHMAPHVDAVHTYDHVSPSDRSLPRRDELSPLRCMHSPYPLLPAGIVSSDNISTDGDFPQPSEIYPWGSFHLSPNLPQNTVSQNTFHHPTTESVPHFNSSSQQSHWDSGAYQVDYGDEFSSTAYNQYQYPSSAHSPHNHSPSFDSDSATQPHVGTLDASSYPCLWTEGGVICNIMVQATRSQMNRHLHAYHGFGGSDTRQTRCCWAGCGETMQQGSIARHMVTCHLQTKVTCPTCSKKLSRQDVISKHQRVCPAASTWR